MVHNKFRQSYFQNTQTHHLLLSMRVCPSKYANALPSVPADIFSSWASSCILYSSRLKTRADGLPSILVAYPGKHNNCSSRGSYIAHPGQICGDELLSTGIAQALKTSADELCPTKYKSITQAWEKCIVHVARISHRCSDPPKSYCVARARVS